MAESPDFSPPDIPYAKEKAGESMRQRAEEIAALQAWSKGLRDQIETAFHDHGLDDRFIGIHFRSWAHHYGVYR